MPVLLVLLVLSLCRVAPRYRIALLHANIRIGSVA